MRLIIKLPMPRRRAFTLIELLVTVGILTLLAAFIVPVFELMLSQLQLATATNDVAELMRQTNQKTVTEQVIYGVTFTSGASTIPQFLYNTSNGTKTIQSTYTLPSNICIDTVSFSSNTDIRFSTSGAPNASGYVVLVDTVRNRRREIDLRPSGSVFANQSEY
jgi:prepilin-type N-terminal cleavage/methylation domain-containing protein